MHKAFVIVPLVGWAGIAGLIHYGSLSFPSRANEGTVVMVSPRGGEAAQRTPIVPEPARAQPSPGNRTALVRELQKELTRVGCYDGEISGTWTTSSRRAMRDFTDRINAKLPIDEPDHILLSLVQGHRQKACGIPCPAGQEAGAGGRCVSSAVEAAKQPSPTGARTEEPSDRTGIITGSTTAAAAVAAAAVASSRQPDRATTATAPMKQAAAPPPSPTDTEGAQRGASKSGPVPQTGVHDRQSTRQARRAKSQPPAVVRSLVRNVKSVLGSFGIR